MRWIQVTTWVPAREDMCGTCFVNADEDSALLLEQLKAFFKPEIERLKNNGRMVRIFDKSKHTSYNLNDLPADGRQLALFRSMDRLKGIKY